jgi:hypothetical protein
MKKFGISINIFDYKVLNQYHDLKIQLYSIFQEKMNENPKTTIKLIDLMINEIKLKIAENNQGLRDLEIEIENFTPVKGFVSKHTIKKNNLLSINDKLNLLIDDLKFFRDNFKPVNESTHKKGGTFESLFRDSNNARKVKEIFENKGYTVKGEWQGLANDKSELLCAYYVLKNLIKPGLKIAPTVKIIYSEFGLPENHITDRMMTIEPFNDIRKEFEIVFSDLLEPKIKK